MGYSILMSIASTTISPDEIDTTQQNQFAPQNKTKQNEQTNKQTNKQTSVTPLIILLPIK